MINLGLREKRLEKGWTLKELSERSGVHLVKIQQIESGKIKAENISLRNARKLADALGCSTKDLL